MKDCPWCHTDPNEITALKQRVAELERELEAARKTLVRIVDEDCEHLLDSTNDLRLIAANALAALTAIRARKA